ncbi:unnamed protein product [Cladocopium goreaui]|uniref:Uncharacterized protein n=1 Tax=Cladocopium goreaui TaxID=2562237 RepID=A0A9P1GJN4_9DINO|nr:unnamed protein product [Cladocopium goreaui]
MFSTPSTSLQCLLALPEPQSNGPPFFSPSALAQFPFYGAGQLGKWSINRGAGLTSDDLCVGTTGIGSFLAPLLEVTFLQELLVLATFAFSFTLWRRLKPARKEALFASCATKPKDGLPVPQKVLKTQEDFTEEEQEHAKTTEKEMQNLLARVPGIGTTGSDGQLRMGTTPCYFILLVATEIWRVEMG